MKNKKTTTTLAARLMKIHNRNPAITSERRMQISTTVLVTSITSVLAIGFFISPPIVSPATAAVQTTSSPGTTTNTPPTLGNPSIIYIESDRSSPFHSVFINGTHAQATAFTGNGTLAGIPDTDTGTAYLVTRSDGSVYTFGNGAVVSKVGSGMLIYTFDAVGHYMPDGKLHDTGHIIVKSTSGNLASLSDKVGIYKDWYNGSGNGLTTMWFWRG